LIGPFFAGRSSTEHPSWVQRIESAAYSVALSRVIMIVKPSGPFEVVASDSPSFASADTSNTSVFPAPVVPPVFPLPTGPFDVGSHPASIGETTPTTARAPSIPAHRPRNERRDCRTGSCSLVSDIDSFGWFFILSIIGSSI
jgi:hypothetical protein